MLSLLKQMQVLQNKCKMLCNTVENQENDMQKLRNIPKIKQSKLLVELSLASLLYILYLLVLPVMWLIAKVTKTTLYIPLANGHDLELYIFNTRCNLIKYLPLNKSILQRKIFLVGTNLYHKTSDIDATPGLISLYGSRSFIGIAHLSVEDTDHEYLQQTSVWYDFKLCIRFLFASVFSSTKTSYLPRLDLMDVRFMNMTMKHTVELIKTNVEKRKKSNIYFINADTLNKAYKNKSLHMVLNKTPYVFPDGIGIKIACNMMNMPLKENINGTDMFPFICKMAEKEGMKIFLYGAKDSVAEKMKRKVLTQFPNLKIVGAINGYDLNDKEVVNMINYSEADIVFVAKGAPLQEQWINTHSNQIVAPVILGVGGLFDFYSGNIPRAPMWMREIGLEWIYRLMQEPKRMWKRYILGNPLFLIRTYLWHKKQKQKRMKKYFATVSRRQTLSFLPDISFMTYRFYPIAKRMIDIFVTLAAILLLSPLMIIVAIFIRVESKGSIFFSQKRVGLDGKLFDMYKFRSMVQNAEALKKELTDTNESQDGVTFKMKNDPRITKVGKFIRKWSIDELPQLFNVLKGDMSLVGPRPPVPSEVVEYVNNELKRLHIAPGITCYWQVSGRSEIPFKQQVALDIKYIATRSLWTDIKILFATVPAVLAKKGAY